MPDLSTQITSTLNGLQQEFFTITHNMANANTVGFKRQTNSFSRTLAAQGAGTEAQTKIAGEVDVKSMFDFTQGNLIENGSPLDCALLGKGFFVVETTNGPLYTRNGMFQLNAERQIVDSNGRIVAGTSGPITIPSTVGLSQIQISENGKVSAGGTDIGQLRVVDFKDREPEMVAVGLNCFKAPSDAKPEEATAVTVRQGALESSNVQIMEELVDMIMVSRLYESNMKFMNVSKDTSKSIIDVAMS